MATTQELLDERAGIWAQAQEFKARSDKGEDMSAEDEAAWDRALVDVDELTAKIKTRETDARIAADFAAVDDKAREEGVAAAAPVTGQTSDAERYRATFKQWAKTGIEGLGPDEKALMQANFGSIKDAQSTTTTAGGYTVPEGFWRKVTEVMKYYGGAADGADIITTDSGAPLPWPTNDDTATVGYQLGENTQATSEGDLVFGQKSLGAWTFVSGPILLSFQLAQDTGIDIEAFIAKQMGQRLGRIENTKQTTGVGTTTPQGYVTGATTGKTTSTATAILYNEIIDLIHSVDAAYRATGRCRFKLHDLILAYVRKLRDDSGGAGLGRPLWEPSVQAGVPDLLLGYPYSVNNDMASAVTTGLKTMAFGDFQSAFAIRRVAGAQMMRLTERYADSLQIGFIGYERMDSIVQDASAVKLLVQA